MRRLDDLNFRYYTKAESEQPGYLEKRMEIYKQMVGNEQDRAIHQQSEDLSIYQRHHGAFSSEQKHSKPTSQFIVVGGKG